MYRNNWPSRHQVGQRIPIRQIRRDYTTPPRNNPPQPEFVEPFPQPNPEPPTATNPAISTAADAVADAGDPIDLGTATQQPTTPPSDKIEPAVQAEIDWQAVALQTRADMDNFRRRQTRRADEAIVRERERLLQQFLPIVDNLHRALSHHEQAEATLQEGVALVYRQVLHTLAKEGVTPIEALQQPFDPELHEAVAIAPAQAESGIILEEIETGYKLADKLLRPARVVVAD